MADLFINVDFSSGHSKKQSGQGSRKHQRFIKRRRELERRGFLKQKQLPHRLPNRRAGQPRNPREQNGQAGCNWGGHDSNNNTFHQQGAPDRSSRTVSAGAAHQPGSLSISINCAPNRPRPASPFKGQKSPAGEGAKKPAKPYIQQHNPLSEYESGLPSAQAPSHKIVAIDCEMVGTGPKGRNSALARCSIVNYQGDVVYDKYVKPPSPVTDYRTRWSGIQSRHLVNATPFQAAQKEVLKLLHGKMVVGHAIQNDYKALGYFHPKELTRDTSKIPLLNRRAGLSEKEAVSLKRLAKLVLHKDIQMGKHGHSSVEDAKTTMELYRAVEAECEMEGAVQQ